MADYFVIDADSHVEELEDAWNFLREKYRERMPFLITVPNRSILANLNPSSGSTLLFIRRFPDRSHGLRHAAGFLSCDPHERSSARMQKDSSGCDRGA